MYDNDYLALLEQNKILKERNSILENALFVDSRVDYHDIPTVSLTQAILPIVTYSSEMLSELKELNKKIEKQNETMEIIRTIMASLEAIATVVQATVAAIQYINGSKGTAVSPLFITNTALTPLSVSNTALTPLWVVDMNPVAEDEMKSIEEKSKEIEEHIQELQEQKEE